MTNLNLEEIRAQLKKIDETDPNSRAIKDPIEQIKRLAEMQVPLARDRRAHLLAYAELFQLFSETLIAEANSPRGFRDKTYLSVAWYFNMRDVMSFPQIALQFFMSDPRLTKPQAEDETVLQENQQSLIQHLQFPKGPLQ